MNYELNNIRNFVIIAHIDHGKSTLADRFLEITDTVESRKMRPQYLDQLELEREKGITIKMAPVRMIYHPHRGTTQNSRRLTQTDISVRDELLYEDLTYQIRGAAFEVRKNIGLGHKEIVYQKAFAEELREKRLRFEKEKIIDVIYNGKKIGVYQPDFVIENKVIIELKALPSYGRTEEKQLWNYLKGSLYKLAMLINFGSKDLEIKRIVYDIARFPRESTSSPRESAEIEEYILNLIDTPGHSDFSYEVSRALTAVEGAILLVDATKGIQAQTLANFRLAIEAGLKIIGAINKIDLVDQSRTEARVRELADLLACSSEEIFKISAKTGEGVKELLGAIIERILPPVFLAEPRFARSSGEHPLPLGAANPTDTQLAAPPRASAQNTGGSSRKNLSPLFPRALIFDSLYNDHKGILAFIRIFNGGFAAGDEVFLAAAKKKFKIKEIGYFTPQLKSTQELKEGEIGYIATGLKEPNILKIGDTVLSADLRRLSTRINAENDQRASASSPRESAAWALPGYREPKPVVFVSFYPDGRTKFEELKNGFERLRLNDPALNLEIESNEALGRGLKVGFLGRLHFEIAASRLAREFNLEFINSFPSVAYRVGEQILKKAQDFPEKPLKIFQPMIRIYILTPPIYAQNIMAMAKNFYLEIIETKNLGDNLVLGGLMPLAQLIEDFDDKLKSVSAGFASFSYELAGEAPAELEKLEILLAGNPIPSLTQIVPKKELLSRARKLVERLKEILPRQQFVQAIQAVGEGRIIARENIPALAKNVTGHLYGGDRTRKMKLWKKQQKGKEKLKKLGRVIIPAEAFKELLKK